jgi:hypothetical protein
LVTLGVLPEGTEALDDAGFAHGAALLLAGAAALEQVRESA